jgi:hypothetical protein
LARELLYAAHRGNRLDADATLQLAGIELDDGDYLAAIRLLNSLPGEFATNPDATRMRTQCLEELQQLIADPDAQPLSLHDR